MMAEFNNIFIWNHIPKSKRTHSKSPSPDTSIDFRDTNKSELDDRSWTGFLTAPAIVLSSVVQQDVEVCHNIRRDYARLELIGDSTQYW